MADVKIRQLEDWVLESHRTRAKTAGRSLEEELRQVLTDKALEARREFARRAREMQAELKAKYGVMSDSTPGIRADREERG
ncbi:MAG: hypothetical protein JNK11_19990 [Alphaproteobacteria bacterium]|nr:hypothetical protein [Alphaproteobacteria bacterium]